MSDLPAGWEWADTGSITEVQGGIQKQPKRRPVANHYPFLRVANVMRGLLDLGEVHEVELFDGELERYRLRAGDLLVVEGNGSPGQIGRAARWGGEIEDCVHQNHLIRVRPTSVVDSKYLAYYWNSPRTTQYLRSVASSTSGLHVLTASKVRSVRIPLPPKSDQLRIVAAIEEQFSRLGAGMNSLKKARKNLARIRGAIVQASVSGNWPLFPLSEMIDVLRNGIFVSRPTAEPCGQAILRISAVRPMALNTDDIRYVPPSSDLRNAENYFVEPEDLLFTRYSGTPELVGACAMVPSGVGKLLHPDKLIRVKVNRSVVEPRFIELAASAGPARREIRNRVKTTAGQTGISGSDLKSVPFPLPPIEIQRRIIVEADRKLTWLQQAERSTADAEQRASALRSSILAAAFSGKLT